MVELSFLFLQKKELLPEGAKPSEMDLTKERKKERKKLSENDHPNSKSGQSI